MLTELQKNHWLLDEFPQNFTLDGDWLNFKNSVRGLEGVKVLLTLDESTYDPVRPQFKETGGNQWARIIQWHGYANSKEGASRIL